MNGITMYYMCINFDTLIKNDKEQQGHLKKCKLLLWLFPTNKRNARLSQNWTDQIYTWGCGGLEGFILTIPK